MMVLLRITNVIINLNKNLFLLLNITTSTFVYLCILFIVAEVLSVYLYCTLNNSIATLPLELKYRKTIILKCYANISINMQSNDFVENEF